MPELNETRKVRTNIEIYSPCVDCGRLRWVRLAKGKPRNIRCLSCQLMRVRNNRPPVVNRPYPENPKLGDIYKGREINHGSPSANYILSACANCGKERWVHAVKGKPVSLICQDCQLQDVLKIAHSMPQAYHKGENHWNWQGGLIKRKCTHCGNVFLARRAHIRNGYGKFCSHSCATIFYIKDGLLERRPTKPELKLLEIIERHKLPFKYIGDGKRWIGRCNPDFININKTRQVIEVFGIYWHDVFDVSKRIEALRHHNFDCLVFWEDELNNENQIVSRIKRFCKKQST